MQPAFNHPMETAMHFSDTHTGNASRLTKIAIVTALHLAVGLALINNMNKVGVTQIIDDIDMVFVPDKLVEPPPPPPALPETQVQQTLTPPPPVVVARTEVEIEAAPLAPTVTTTTEVQPVAPATLPVAPAVALTPAPKVAAEARRTAVLADANACVKPDYPARAARLGESGTVSLALLVGVDGKVADARIERSSGSRELDRAAVAALSMCKFKPATSGGVPEQGWAQLAYVWTLDI